jgi:hypothetical protein
MSLSKVEVSALIAPLSLGFACGVNTMCNWKTSLLKKQPPQKKHDAQKKYYLYFLHFHIYKKNWKTMCFFLFFHLFVDRRHLFGNSCMHSLKL